jgi:hypothetical protein
MPLLKHFRKPEVRASVQSALITSTNLPNSGLTFVDNSQGCSAAVAELSGLLDVAIDQFDCESMLVNGVRYMAKLIIREEEPSDQLHLQLKRLFNEAEQYLNSTLGSGQSDVQAWHWLVVKSISKRP